MNVDVVRPEEIAAMEATMRSDVPLGEVTTRYLNACDPGFQRHVQVGMTAMLANCTESFREHRDAPVAICTPVEAETEGLHIGRTLAQYPPQRQAPRHRLLLHANHVKGADERRLDRTLGIISRFMADNPRFPLGLMEDEYEEPPPIGALRNYIAGVALGFTTESKERIDGILLNHDADIPVLYLKYLQRIYRTFCRNDRLTAVVLSAVRHARGRLEGGGQPNMDMVTAWFDLPMALADTNYYDLGTAVSMRAYENVGGYNPTLRKGETLDLIKRIASRMPPNERGVYRAPGSYLWTSSRRPRMKLYQSGSQNTEFWSDDDFEPQVFGPFADYRNRDTTQLRDISAEKRDKEISLLASFAFFQFLDYYSSRYPNEPGARTGERIIRTLHIAKLRLGGPDDLLEGVTQGAAQDIT